MAKSKVFIDRRKRDRRSTADPCKQLPMDLYHRKRRKSRERREEGRTLADDYYAYMSEPAPEADVETPSREEHNTPPPHQ